jgi:hypothetical protein
MPSVMDGQRFQALAAENFAGSSEPATERVVREARPVRIFVASTRIGEPRCMACLSRIEGF